MAPTLEELLAAPLANIKARTAAYAASHPIYAQACVCAHAARSARDRTDEAYAANPSTEAAEIRAAAYDAYEAAVSSVRAAYISGK